MPRRQRDYMRTKAGRETLAERIVAQDKLAEEAGRRLLAERIAAGEEIDEDKVDEITSRGLFPDVEAKERPFEELTEARRREAEQRAQEGRSPRLDWKRYLRRNDDES